MIINRGNLRDLQVGFKGAFQGAFDKATPKYQSFCTVVPSTTAEEFYGWLGSFPGMREWIGERIIKNIAQTGYTIRNRSWESTISVPRERIADDQYGIYTPMFDEMGRMARMHPDELAFGLLKAGFSTLCFDNQFMFDIDHPVLDAQGVEYSVSNMQAGSGAPWFLMDLSRSVRPMIFQERQKPEMVAKDDPDTSDEVFMRNTFLYGAYARYNVGFGFWQMAYGSKAALTQASFRAARTAMMSLKSDLGEPLNIKPTHIIVGTSNADAARDLFTSERLANGQSNTDRNLVEVIESTYLD